MTKPDPNLRKLQLAELEILKYFKKICDDNNLRYYMLGGTFLGAIRHKGFIPWDDDIDLGMPRKDFLKFTEIVMSDEKAKFNLESFRTNPSSLMFVARFENRSIKIEDASTTKTKIRYAWIDIFPMDGMPKNKIALSLHKLHLLYLRLLVQYSQYSLIVNQQIKHRPPHERFLMWLGKKINFEKILDARKCLEKLDTCIQKYDFDTSENVANFMGAYKFKEMFRKDIYDHCSLYDFEDTKLNAPSDYDFVLTQLYGDYMTPPAVDERNKHGTKVIEDNTK